MNFITSVLTQFLVKLSMFSPKVEPPLCSLEIFPLIERIFFLMARLPLLEETKDIDELRRYVKFSSCLGIGEKLSSTLG